VTVTDVSGRVRIDLPCSGDHERFAHVYAASAHALTASATCPECSVQIPLHLEQRTDSGGLTGCLACGHVELYTRKDFPRALGIGIVVLAAVLVPFLSWWYPSLIAAAALDLLLHWYAPEVVVCYVCEAEHRGFTNAPRHPRFDRTIEERLKYGEQAVMGSPMRPGGTADAPEPEH
jgi:Zn ribbon nucleic-acid-binding protein